jgi:hypothetical protein
MRKNKEAYGRDYRAGVYGSAIGDEKKEGELKSAIEAIAQNSRLVAEALVRLEGRLGRLESAVERLFDGLTLTRGWPVSTPAVEHKDVGMS